MTWFASSVGAISLLGAALVGGIFFTFSSFVMKALGKVSSSEGIRVMQTINVVVINPSFVAVFMGTTVLSVVMAVMAILDWRQASSIFYLVGAASYLAGTFIVTIRANVPLNHGLAAVSAEGDSARATWNRYLDRWTRWNHVRTVAALLAAVLFLAGLMQGQST